jgi:hypothetical protein
VTQRILNARSTPEVEIVAESQATLDRITPLPSRLILSGIPPTQDQGTTGICVAEMAYGLYNWAYKRKYGKFADLDAYAFYDLCKLVDHDPDPDRWHGTTLLTALRVMAGSGFPLKNGARAPKIEGYEYVGSTSEDVQRAILTFGTPVGWRVNWDAQWFYLPRSRILKAPIGQIVGGHAMYTFGFDDSVNLGSDTDKNSWGAWSVAGNGNCYFADRYKDRPEAGFEAWRVTGIR